MQASRSSCSSHTQGEQLSNNIAGKVVVITGASSGLGEATARALSAEGATVVLGARRTERLESLVTELTAAGGKALAVTTDVTHYDQVKQLVDTAVETYGRIDVMINNAGVMPRAPLDRLTIEDWDRAIDVNIKGVLYGISAALPHMEAQMSGHIINVSSVSGHKIGKEFSVYSATKFAVRALSEGLRMEVKPYNIRTTIISPGVITTELPQSISSAGHCREDAEGLRRPCDSTRFVCTGRRLRDEPARRRGHQRNPLPPHTPRGLIARSTAPEKTKRPQPHGWGRFLQAPRWATRAPTFPFVSVAHFTGMGTHGLIDSLTLCRAFRVVNAARSGICLNLSRVGLCNTPR